MLCILHREIRQGFRLESLSQLFQGKYINSQFTIFERILLQNDNYINVDANQKTKGISGQSLTFNANS